MGIFEYVQAHFATWFFAALAAIFGALYRLSVKRLKSWKVEQDAIKDGVVAILHDRLYQGCMYHLKNKAIEYDELKNMEHLYKSYHALGGNGTGTELFERIKKLPLKED